MIIVKNCDDYRRPSSTSTYISRFRSITSSKYIPTNIKVHSQFVTVDQCRIIHFSPDIYFFPDIRYNVLFHLYLLPYICFHFMILPKNLHLLCFVRPLFFHLQNVTKTHIYTEFIHETRCNNH